MPPTDERRPPLPRGDGQYRLELRPAGAGLLIARLGGDLDYMVTPRVRRGLIEPIDDALTVLVVDLTQVTLLSAAAMEMLLELDQLAAARGCEVRIVAVTRTVLRPLSLLGLDRSLRLRSSVPQAIQG
ncbi:MAG: STAS domain-containing protein [Jatrophihabitans sp.]